MKCENSLIMIEVLTISHVIRRLVMHARQLSPKNSTFALVRTHEEPIEGRVLLESTVSGWLGFFVFYRGKAVFGRFG